MEHEKKSFFSWSTSLTKHIQTILVTLPSLEVHISAADNPCQIEYTGWGRSIEVTLVSRLIRSREKDVAQEPLEMMKGRIEVTLSTGEVQGTNGPERGPLELLYDGHWGGEETIEGLSAH